MTTDGVTTQDRSTEPVAIGRGEIAIDLPQQLKLKADHWGKPVFVNPHLQLHKLGTSQFAECTNCGDRGFITAFFADYDTSASTKKGVPICHSVKERGADGKSHSIMKVVAWIHGGWWVGNHSTFPCPLCAKGVQR